MKEQFRDQRFGAATQSIIDDADTILADFQRQGYRMTLRQLYYQFIAQDLFPEDWMDLAYNQKHGLDPTTKNTLKNYKRLVGIVADGRIAGELDWDTIEDRIREPKLPSEFSSIKEIAEAAARGFRLPRWEGQGFYLELWVEKDALASILGPTARKHHITLMINRGYSSASAMYESAKRFKDAIDANLDPILLYCGDFDPSGEDMVRDVEDRLGLFGATVCVEKVALTKAQIRRYKPPTNPAKVTDSRAKAYIEEHGPNSWEIEALRPPVLVGAVESAIRPYLNQPLMDTIIAREDEQRKALVDFAATLE